MPTQLEGEILDLKETVRQMKRDISDLQADKASKEEVQKLNERYFELKQSISEINIQINLIKALTQGLVDDNKEITSDIKIINEDLKKIEDKLSMIECMNAKIDSFTKEVGGAMSMLQDFLHTSITFRLSQTKKSISELGNLVKGKSRFHKGLWYLLTWGTFSFVFIVVINYFLHVGGSDFKFDLNFFKWLVELFK